MKRNLKGSTEQKFFTLYWGLVQKYFIPEDNDEYWQDLFKDADAIINQFDNNEWMHKTLLAFLDECERKYKRIKAGEMI